MKKIALPWLFLAALGVSVSLSAAPTPQDAATIQKQLKAAQQSLSQQQQQKKQLDVDIGKTQASLQDATNKLAQLTAKQQQSAAELARLQQQLLQLQAQNQSSKAQVQRLLNSQYKNKQPEALVLMLKNSNPNDKGRQMVYLRYLNQANNQVLRDLKQQLADITQQQQKIADKTRQLQQLQQQSAAAAQRLHSQHAKQVKESRTLAQGIVRQQDRIATLKRDEQRLTQLLANLGRKQALKTRPIAKVITKPKHSRPPSVQPSKPVIPPRDDSPTPTMKQPSKPIEQGLTQEDLALNAPAEAALITTPSNRFSQMQGRMSLPMQGAITGRFGGERNGGGTWKGLFIASAGAAVHSVAAGEVVYAAPLTGYGNTVIVDHGGGYMTVYAGLSGVSVGAGQDIAARATLGNSGALPSGERGLYFEVRYQSRAMNPLSWLG